MTNKKAFKDLAKINTGYAFRTAIVPENKGEISVLQAKDIKQGQYLEAYGLLPKVSEISRNNSFLKWNDVLLTSRCSKGSNYKATVFKSKSENIIATSTLYIIRVKDQLITPEYFSLYLNSPAGQRNLVQNSTGGRLQSLLRKSIEALEIPVPSLEKQRKIVALQENIWNQEKILKRKSEIRGNIVNTILQN